MSSDTDMQDANLAQSRTAAGNQALASTAFNHGSLSICNSVPAPSQPLAPQASPQINTWSPADAGLDPFQGNHAEVARFCVQSTLEQLGPGRKTPEDIFHYCHFKYYPARPIDHLEIDIEFTLSPTDGDTFTSLTVATLPASACNTFSNLMKVTKELWQAVYRQAVAPFPVNGIWAKGLRIMFVETHGDARGTWKVACSSQRYEKWYHDHVVHGRFDSLKLHLMYTEPA